MSARSIVKKLIPKGFLSKITPYGHLVESFMLHAINGFPLRGLKVIGVTGTNGKTSTSFMIHRMLVESGYKAGLMTTVAYGVGDDIHQQIAHMTSVSAKDLIARVKAMKAAGMDWLVLETTSHGLAQYRVWGVPYSIAVFTNLTHEHLDYHGTFERYRDAKRMMFKMCNRNKRGLRLGVVNAEDENSHYFAEDIANVQSYGIKSGDIRAQNLKLTPSGSRYLAKIGDDEYKIECHLPGTFNVSNSLAAVLVGRAVGLSKDQIQQGIAALKGVEGRMERIDEGQDFDVIVDFAHTPDSFEKLFKDLKPVVKGQLIALFGSAGRRDEAKRAEQGRLAGKYANVVVVTEEDDRDIDGSEIMNQIAEGAEEAGKTRDKDLFLVHDRPEAIQFAVNMAKAGDTVILLGKGHEKDILRNGPRAAELRHLPQDDSNPERVTKIVWNEMAEARKALRKCK
jgi:UDP-N-acetylmuramoyl-L-alanyl-D-glutamate--2,6-diaminopimelate ligase